VSQVKTDRRHSLVFLGSYLFRMSFAIIKTRKWLLTFRQRYNWTPTCHFHKEVPVSRL